MGPTHLSDVASHRPSLPDNRRAFEEVSMFFAFVLALVGAVVLGTMNLVAARQA